MKRSRSRAAAVATFASSSAAARLSFSRLGWRRMSRAPGLVIPISLGDKDVGGGRSLSLE